MSAYSYLLLTVNAFNESKEEANIRPKVKISLLMRFVPRNVSPVSEGEENMIFLQSNMSYSIQNIESCLGRRKEALRFGCEQLIVQPHIHTRRCAPTQTGPCRGHILPSNGPTRCACSRPACCVCLYCTWSVWYHLSATHPESGPAGAAFASSLLDFFCCFSFSKNDG